MAETVIIDALTREITVPESERAFGVAGEHDVTRKHFRINGRIVDGNDIAVGFAWKVCTENSAKQPNEYPIDSIIADSEGIEFDWLVGKGALAYKGGLKFAVCAKHVDGEGKIQHEWHSKIGMGDVSAGIEAGAEDIGGFDLRAYIQQTAAEVRQAVQNAASAADAAETSAQTAETQAGNASRAASSAAGNAAAAKKSADDAAASAASITGAEEASAKSATAAKKSADDAAASAASIAGAEEASAKSAAAAKKSADDAAASAASITGAEEASAKSAAAAKKSADDAAASTGAAERSARTATDKATEAETVVADTQKALTALTEKSDTVYSPRIGMYTATYLLDEWVAVSDAEKTAGYGYKQTVKLVADSDHAPTVTADSELVTVGSTKSTGVAATDITLQAALGIICDGYTETADGSVVTLVKKKPSAEVAVRWGIMT